MPTAPIDLRNVARVFPHTFRTHMRYPLSSFPFMAISVMYDRTLTRRARLHVRREQRRSQKKIYFYGAIHFHRNLVTL